MMRPTTSVAVLFPALLAWAETSSVFNIEIPASLHRTNGYRHKEATFGAPTYNKMMSQRLYYSNSTLCVANEGLTGGYPPGGPGTTPYILMVDRGECSFVTKARNAQSLGASAVAVADDRCICGECYEFNCETVEPVMADDGSGSDISIPAILVWKTDADVIKQYLRCGTLSPCPKDPPMLYVQAQLEYSLPQPDDRVEWSLWTTSVDRGSVQFVVDFKKTALALGTDAYFEPHFDTYNGTAYHCGGAYNDCGSLCTNGGRYCAPDPDAYFYSGIDGKDIVVENLRRTCIWQIYGSDTSSQPGVGEVWWDYVAAFGDLCAAYLEKFTDPQCVSLAMRKAKVDISKVEACMADSGGVGPDDGVNTILEREIAELVENNVYLIPECIVNTKPIWGGLSTSNVLTSICQGYAPGHQPAPCECQGLESAPVLYQSCLDSSRKDVTTTHSSTTTKKTTTKSGVQWWAVFLLIVLVMLAMVFVGFAYWKKTQTQMRDEVRGILADQVRGILAEYMPLDGGGPLEGNNNPIHTPGPSQELPTTSSNGASSSSK